MALFKLSHSNATFHGGNYTQVNNIQNIQQQSSWDRLQSAAAPSAFHDSGDNFDVPKCHANTRVAVMNELRNFAHRRGDTGEAKLLWLNGPAGAGKSAIARSLCEECAVNSLLASFFFSRSDSSRNTHKSFVATIAYEIYGHVPPYNQSLMLDVIERDPLVFTRSVEAQFQSLIVDPLRNLFENNSTKRYLIVIDGLDECATASAQVAILTMLLNVSRVVEIPFVFLVASRPENEIQAFFRTSSPALLIHRLTLNDSYLPHADIELFLRDKFREVRSAHPLKSAIPHTWPLDRNIENLVQNSSGLFIYASVVVKYVTSNRHFPPDRLDAVLQLLPLKGDLPFTELDKLYSHIFSCVEDLDLALHIISYCFPGMGEDVCVDDISRINEINTDRCILALCDLWSIFGIETVYSKQRIIVFHQSIWDYLFDETRSGRYHINKNQALVKIATQCFQYLSEVKYTSESRDTRNRIIEFLGNTQDWLISNIQLSHNAFLSFSLVHCYDTFSSLEVRLRGENTLFHHIFGDEFFLKLLNDLCFLAGTSYGHVYQHFLNEYRRLTDLHPDVYRLGQQQINPVALITILILSDGTISQMPQKVFESAAIGLLNNPSISLHKNIRICARFLNLGNLFCHAALRCFAYLKQNNKLNVTAVILRYLTWVLAWASRSSVLDIECHTLDMSAFDTTEDHILLTLAHEVAAVIQDYILINSQKYGKPESLDIIS